MKQTIQQKLKTGLVAAVAASSLIFSAQGADLIAYWDFETVEADGVSIKAKVGPYTGTIAEAAILTAPGDGRPNGGGKGFDVGIANKGWLLLEAEGDANPMTAAASDDSMTVVLWQKNYSNIDSSSFWAIGPENDRSFQFHVPWSNGRIYFDTAGGCCAVPGQRLDQSVTDIFPDHDWLAWHHYAFVKNGGFKAVYVDGTLLMSQEEGAAPLPTEYTRLTIGGANNAQPPDAVIDDVAIFKGALSATDIGILVSGQPPTALVVDTDGDGMPDGWETQYGLNPNSPADAPLDADNDGATNLQEFLAGTNPTDTTKPTLTSATGSGSFNQVTLVFSEALDPVSATTAANYSLSPSLAVTGATLKKNTVTLTTAAQTPGAVSYTVTVVNVLDTSKNAVAANTTAKFYSYNLTKTGVLKFSFWGDITGTTVPDLQADPRYPASPDSTGTVFSFNSRDILPTDAVDNFGATIEGLITPTESGDYNFFLRSDDLSELHISPDSSEANLVLQAYNDECCLAFMEPGDIATTAALPMVAGTKYFVRVIYKEGTGGDYAQVAWRKTTDTTPAASLTPIPGTFLSSPVDLPVPPEGAYVTQTPAANAKNVSPATAITIAHRDGNTPWTSANVSLKLNGAAVTPVITKVGNLLTINYVPPALLPSASIQTVTLSYLDPGANPATLEYSFTTFAYSAPTVDKVAARPAYITGASKYTAAGGGKSGQASDYGMDLTAKGGALINFDASWANVGTAKDELSVVFWQKKYDIAASSAFWFNSPASADTARGFQAHNPWDNGNIYFDTGGASDAAVPPTRVFANIDTFQDYTGDIGFWTNSWHHFAFTKKGGIKQVWIDGKLFLQGDDSPALKSDFTSLYIGSDGAGGGLAHALVDDFAVFSTQLIEADVQALTGGTLPSALPAAKGLVAYWDFNDAATTTLPTISITGTTITFTGTLTSTSTIGGTFAPVAGATSPYTIPAATEGAAFYRSAN